MPARTRPNGGAASGAATNAAIRAAAVELFWSKGYEATTMRELAAHVGVEAGSLYNHFPSKQRLLAEILISTMETLLARVTDELADEPDDDPAARLRAAIRAYVAFHADYLAEAALTDTERRSLSGEDLERLLALRRELAGLFREIIVRGAELGAFEVEDVGIATLAVLSICARVPIWYRPDGRLTLERVSELLAGLSLSALRARP